jgi:hypothetical protein
MFSGSFLDKIADKLQMKIDMDGKSIKATFFKEQSKEFTSFDARQKYTCIMNYLEQEIDFEHL